MATTPARSRQPVRAPARKMPAGGRAQPSLTPPRPAPGPALTKSGKVYANADARMRALFLRQKLEARRAAVFLSGLAGLGAGADGGDAPLSMTDRTALAAKYEKISVEAAALMKAAQDNKAVFSTEDATALQAAMGAFSTAMDDVRTLGRSGTYNNTAITRNNVGTVVKSLNKALGTALADYAAAVEKYNKGGTAEWAGKAASGLKLLAGTLWNVATAPLRFAKYIAIGVAVLFLAPPIIKIILAARKGGMNAALEESAHAAEAARDAVKAGAQSAASLAARAGAAYMTGGASEAMKAGGGAIPGLPALPMPTALPAAPATPAVAGFADAMFGRTGRRW